MSEATEAAGKEAGELGAPWWLRLLFPLLPLALALVWYTPHWMGNDDPGMNLLAAGAALAPEPSPFLLFVHPLVGQLLSTLYRCWPSLPWYALFLFAAMLLASTALSWACLAGPGWRTRAALLLAFFLTFVLSAMVVVQFTLVAALCGQAALVWWWLGRERQRGLGWHAALLGLVLLAVAVRAESGQMLCVFAAPLALVDLWLACSGGGLAAWRAWALRTAVPVLAAVAVAVLMTGYRDWFYESSPGWRGFRSYYQLLARFTDYHRGPPNQALLPQLAKCGWSENDYELVRWYFCADREVYSEENLQRLASPGTRPSLSWPTVTAALAGTWNNPALAPLIGAALVPFFFLRRQGWLIAALVLASGAVAFVLVAALGHYCPPHFVQGMLGFAAVSAVALAGPVNWPYFRWLLGCAGCSLLAYSLYLEHGALRKASTVARVESRAYHWHLRALRPQPDQLYVVWGGCLRMEKILPFDSLDDLRNVKAYPLSSLTITPLAEHRLREFGIEDLMAALTDRQDVLLLSCQPCHHPLLEKRYAERRGQRVAFAPVFISPDNMVTVYRVRVVGQESPRPH